MSETVKRPKDIVVVSLYFLQSHRYSRKLLASTFAYATNFIYETNDAWLFQGSAKRIYKLFTEYYRSHSTLEDLYDIKGIDKDVPANVVLRREDFDKLQAFMI